MKFFQCNKTLWEKEPFKSTLSIHAKVAHGVLADRINLSTQNKEDFSDENGIYCFYELPKLAAYIGVKSTKIKEVMRELKAIGLIKAERIHGGGANKYYLATEEEIEDMVIYSGSQNDPPQSEYDLPETFNDLPRSQNDPPSDVKRPTLGRQTSNSNTEFINKELETSSYRSKNYNRSITEDQDLSTGFSVSDESELFGSDDAVSFSNSEPYDVSKEVGMDCSSEGTTMDHDVDFCFPEVTIPQPCICECGKSVPTGLIRDLSIKEYGSPMCPVCYHKKRSSEGRNNIMDQRSSDASPSPVALTPSSPKKVKTIFSFRATGAEEWTPVGSELTGDEAEEYLQLVAARR